jgi:hypothetical protein
MDSVEKLGLGRLYTGISGQISHFQYEILNANLLFIFHEAQKHEIHVDLNSKTVKVVIFSKKIKDVEERQKSVINNFRFILSEEFNVFFEFKKEEKDGKRDGRTKPRIKKNS